MAEAGNTGGNQGGAGSQGNEGAGDKGNQPKKRYLNKYDSIDDAVEKGIGGLEQGFSETRQQLKAIQDLLELAVSPGNGNGNRGDFAPVGSRGSDQGDQGYGRGPQTIEDTIDPAEWITSPGKALKRVNAVRDQQLMNNVGNFVNQAVAGAMAVSDFKRDNPDLIEHEHIVSHFMKETDPRQSLDKRLRKAGEETKKYLKAVRRNGRAEDDESGRAPEGDEYVENAASGHESNVQVGDDGKGDNKDDTLDEYIAQRRKEKSKRFAPPQRGNS